MRNHYHHFIAALLLSLCGRNLTVTRAQTMRAEAIVAPAWVKAVLDFHQAGAVRPAGYRSQRCVILEASWAKAADAKDYRAGHLPGAIHLNTDEFENGYPTWHLRSVRELQRVIGAHGITPSTTVIVYSQQTIAAARAWWVLHYAGVTDVRLLNGGMRAWTAAGYPVETAVNTPRPAKFVARPRMAALATMAYVSARVHDQKAILADARSQKEFVGEISGYDYMEFKGRLPTAINIGDADDAARLYVNADGSLRPADEISAWWAKTGLTNDGREVIFYCGSGWRSSLTFLYAWVLGFDKVRNYSDGWGGWSTVYLPDKRVKGGTPGWRQRRSANPYSSGTPTP